MPFAPAIFMSKTLATLLAAGVTLALLAAGGDDSSCHLTLELIDMETGKAMPGVVQVLDDNGQRLPLPELLSRGFGLDLKASPAIHEWSVLPRKAAIRVPRKALRVRAFSGLETEVAELSLDLTGKASHAAQVPLKRFYDAAARGYRSANTHLHLKKITRPESDRYLVEVPLADGLDVVFLSYLERAIEDLEYTSNKYSKSDLAHLSSQGAQYGNGEEHRHNFTAQSQGYGHVMLLNIPELIQPVSIGPGITRQGTDGLPLKPGIEKARSFGSTIIWCHNQWGLEDIPSWIMGRLHANNIFDGGTHGSFKHSFYRYLNAGIHVPFSTGTDWYMYDFSRVYVPAQHMLTPEEWLQVLSQGHSTITNGPLIEFTVDGHGPGDTIELKSAGKVAIRGRAWGRVDFQELELLQNGTPIHLASSQAEAGHFVAEMKFDFDLAAPCWLALRTPPPPVKNDPEFQKPVPKNEYGCDLFGHTSAVHIAVAGREHFDLEAANSLLKEMHDSRYFIEKHALFADESERQRVLAVYHEAIEKFTKRIEGK